MLQRPSKRAEPLFPSELLQSCHLPTIISPTNARFTKSCPGPSSHASSDEEHIPLTMLTL
jgi:hypothetical protein